MTTKNPLRKTRLGGTSKMTKGIVKNDYALIKNKSINNNNNIKKRFINKSNDSDESPKQKKKSLINKRKLVRISKAKKTIDSKSNIDQPKSKYKHSISDLRNYNELLSHGITKHKSIKAKNNSLDKLHALFTSSCKDPYHAIVIPEQYIDYKWDLDTLIEVFEYQFKQAEQYGKKKIKSIGAFIFSEGFHGFKSWSPLLFWHQKMNKTAEGELTDEGKKFMSSLKRADVNGILDLDSSIINKVAKETFSVSNKYVFVDGNIVSSSYPFGIIDAISKYIKQKTNNYKSY